MNKQSLQPLRQRHPGPMPFSRTVIRQRLEPSFIGRKNKRLGGINSYPHRAAGL